MNLSSLPVHQPNTSGFVTIGGASENISAKIAKVFEVLKVNADTVEIIAGQDGQPRNCAFVQFSSTKDLQDALQGSKVPISITVDDTVDGSIESIFPVITSAEGLQQLQWAYFLENIVEVSIGINEEDLKEHIRTFFAKGRNELPYVSLSVVVPLPTFSSDGQLQSLNAAIQCSSERSWNRCETKFVGQSVFPGSFPLTLHRIPTHMLVLPGSTTARDLPPTSTNLTTTAAAQLVTTSIQISESVQTSESVPNAQPIHTSNIHQEFYRTDCPPAASKEKTCPQKPPLAPTVRDSIAEPNGIPTNKWTLYARFKDCACCRGQVFICPCVLHQGHKSCASNHQ